MTRKRFIKILMGARVPRNKAVLIADIARRSGKSYEDAFCDMLNALMGHIKQILGLWEETK